MFSLTYKTNLVEKVLRDYPATRNDDKLLILKVWEYDGLVLNKTQQRLFIEKVLSTESIRRTRQKLQEKGLYLATEIVGKRRKELSVKTAKEIVADHKAEAKVIRGYTDDNGIFHAI